MEKWSVEGSSPLPYNPTQRHPQRNTTFMNFGVLRAVVLKFPSYQHHQGNFLLNRSGVGLENLLV